MQFKTEKYYFVNRVNHELLISYLLFIKKFVYINPNYENI